MRIDHTFIVGVGGTGSHLLESLTKLLAYHDHGTDSIVVIDGDTFEENNNNRQLFNPEFIGVNKAEAAVKRYPWLNLKAQAMYVNGPRFLEIVKEQAPNPEDMLLVVLSVDNHATRKALITAVDNANLQNYIILSPGNSLDAGQVITYAVQRGKRLTPHIFEAYPDLVNPTDKIPGFGCEAEAVSTPQLITANASAALGVLWTVSAILDDKPWHQEIHFNCRKLKLLPQGDPVEITMDRETVAVVAETLVEAVEAEGFTHVAPPEPPEPLIAAPGEEVVEKKKPAKHSSKAPSKKRASKKTTSKKTTKKQPTKQKAKSR